MDVRPMRWEEDLIPTTYCQVLLVLEVVSSIYTVFCSCVMSEAFVGRIVGR